MNEKGTVEAWDCTFEEGCDCPECQLVEQQTNEAAELDAFERMIEMNTPGCCRNGKCSG